MLRAVFSLLGIERMQVAQGALRQGALYDLLSHEGLTRSASTSTVAVLMQHLA